MIELFDEGRDRYLICPKCQQKVFEGEDEFGGDTLLPTGEFYCFTLGCGFSYNDRTEEIEEWEDEL